VPCPASAQLEAQYPEDEESEEAREGTAAHFYATEYLQGRWVKVGDLAPNGYPIDADMLEGAQMWVDDVVKARAELPDPVLYVERSVTMHQTVHPANQGTPDAVLISAQLRKVRLYDFKYGHRYRDAFEDWQTLDYLAGVVEALGLTSAEIQEWKFTVVIVQPRNYQDSHVREWALTGWELLEYIGQLKYAAMACFEPRPQYQTGEHCRDCNGRHVCPALQGANALAMDLATRREPADLPLDKLAAEARLLQIGFDRLEARLTGIKEVMAAHVAKGYAVPYWGMTRSNGTEKWTRPISEVLFLGEMAGVDLAKKPDAITPNQARKAGIPADVVNAYSQRIPGAAKLSLISEKQTRKDFK